MGHVIGVVGFGWVQTPGVQFEKPVPGQSVEVFVLAPKRQSRVGVRGAHHTHPLVPTALFGSIERPVGQVKHLLPAEQRRGASHEWVEAEPNGAAQANRVPIVQLESVTCNGVA